LSNADGRTTGQLRSALARAVLAYDPEAAERRRESARKDASVQSWAEGSGNACLAGRELSPADVVEASARLTEQARWLRQHGAAGNTDQLRAAAYVALLTGRSLDTLLPAVSGYASPSADPVTAGLSEAGSGSASRNGAHATSGSEAFAH